jgi:hypothetical protein
MLLALQLGMLASTVMRAPDTATPAADRTVP